MRHGSTWLAIWLASALPAMPANAGCALGKVTTVPLTVAHGRLYVPMSLNETEGGFMLDTGSETTTLNGDFAEKSHVGIDWHPGEVYYSGAGGRETLRVFQAHVRHIQFGTISFQDWEFGVLPENGKTKGGDAGLLGMDFLHYFDMDVDLQGGTLTLWRLSGCTNIHPVWKGDYDAIPLTHTAHQGVSIPILVDNTFLDVVFDTGAGELVLSRDAAAKAGVTAAMLNTDRDANSHGVGGKFPAVQHQFQLLAVGSEQYKNHYRRDGGASDGLWGRPHGNTIPESQEAMDILRHQHAVRAESG
jgi:predicted aspartyl protease